MKQSKISIARSSFIQSALNDTKISNELLGTFVRYLYSIEFKDEFDKIDNSEMNPKDKKDAFNDLIIKKITPKSFLN